MIDTTPAKASFAIIGAVAAIEAGGKIVAENDIENPANAIAKDLALAYAKANGYRLADAALVVDKDPPAPKSGEPQGARYIVDVGPPGMNLIYFGLDWAHFDLIYSDRASVTDMTSNKVVAKGRCFLPTKKRPDLLGHDALLADKAAELKKLIQAKAAECEDKLKADLKLTTVQTASASD